MPAVSRRAAGPEREDLSAVRLVGDADAVAWVAETLAGSGLGVETLERGGRDDGSSHGPVVWVARPSSAPRPAPALADEAAWTFPCLVVVPSGEGVPDLLSGVASAESFDVVRQPEDAPVLKARLERLLLLHSRRSQTEVLLSNLTDVVYTRTFDGVLTSVNAAAERLFGLPRDALVGRSLAELSIDRGEAESFVRDVNRALESADQTYRRIETLDRHARRRVLDAEALLLRDGRGTPCAVQVVLSDVTDEEAYRAELLLQAERNEILAAVATAARDSLELEPLLASASALAGSRLAAHGIEVWLLDETRTVCRVVHHWKREPALADLLGVELRVAEVEPLQGLVASLEPYVIEDAERLDPASVAATMMGRLGARSGLGVPIQREGEMIGILGVTFAEPRRFPQGDVVFYRRLADQFALAVRGAKLYGNLQKQLEALAVEERRRAEAARDRQRLSAMLVHDLKNPLSAILAALELTLEKERKDPESRLARVLSNAFASARGLGGLIEDALLVYRPADAPEPERSPASPAEALAPPVEEARLLAEAKRVTLDVSFEPGLPRVSLDVPRVRRAAANLLGNAVKFTPALGRIAVTVSLASEGERRFLVLRVADSGPGFPASANGRVATPYARFTGSEEIPGTGLGLAVVQKVARAHGGRLEVGPNEPRGSVVSLFIPA